ncbi:glycosyltransferase [Bacillus sp. FJAT-29790]|uniref:glycosyltransferase family protein n=1 Tax=Bacillus sp. FJAT-29790 TaxID=1895002 RepID=UPI001C2199A8|nr:glycosyltransferase [Bacillus sp. FJAT-29790]MBU8880341.1 glycosyltransferase [Bacillus sp. FJAT-29790]
MRILFLESDPMWIYGLPNGFADAGHDVMISGPLLEASLSDMISSYKPDLIFTMGHTREHSAKKRLVIKKHVAHLGIPHIYWATEDPGYTFTFSLPLIETIQPDFIFTICPPRVDFYREKGYKAAHLDFGYHPKVHFPTEQDSNYDASLAIVANGYPTLYEKSPLYYRFEALSNLLSPFVMDNLRIDFWGRYWDVMEHIIGKKIPAEWIHGFLPYTEANKVYSSADIILGVQNLDSQVTQRTYEILGSGGFLLTNNTTKIRNLFTPGQDLVVSSSPEETIKLVKYYLNHPEERLEIKKAGAGAVKKYSYEERAKYILETITNAGLISKEKAAPGEGKWAYYIDILRETYEVHMIQPKETLWSISKKYGVSVEHIKKLNRLATDMIAVNDYLKIREK